MLLELVGSSALEVAGEDGLDEASEDDLGAAVSLLAMFRHLTLVNSLSLGKGHVKDGNELEGVVEGCNSSERLACLFSSVSERTEPVDSVDGALNDAIILSAEFLAK